MVEDPHCMLLPCSPVFTLRNKSFYKGTHTAMSVKMTKNKHMEMHAMNNLCVKFFTLYFRAISTICFDISII